MRGYSSLLRSRRSIFNEWGREEVACDEFIVNVQTYQTTIYLLMNEEKVEEWWELD